MRFTKMHGAGNDFVVLDLRGALPAPTPEVCARLGDRHFGESPPAAADFKDALAGPSLQPVKDAAVFGLLGGQ